MAFGLYKPGQGYWVRVMTATMGGALIFVAAAWLWGELENASRFIPKPTAQLTLSAPVAGEAAPGQAVTLLGDPGPTGPTEIGTAVVKATEPSGGGARLVIEKLALKPRQELSLVKSVAPAPAGANLTARVSGVQQQNLFDPLYLQGAGVGLLIVAGSVLTYWLVGVREKTSEFLIATDGEMRKVNWSTRKDVIASTWVVILWSVLLAGGLFLVDLVFSKFFELIGVLKT